MRWTFAIGALIVALPLPWGVPVRAEPATAGASAYDCASALSWSNGYTYRPTAAEKDWAMPILSDPDGAGAEPAPAWCGAALDAPREFTLNMGFVCRSIYGHEADAAYGTPAVGALRARSEEMDRLHRDIILEHGWKIDDSAMVRDREKFWNDYSVWSDSTKQRLTGICAAMLADRPIALALERAIDDGTASTKCSAYVASETKSGRWAALDPDIRAWAIQNDYLPHDQKAEPYGACYSAWKTGMEYPLQGQTILELAPISEVTAEIEAIRNPLFAKQALALAQRRTDPASRTALSNLKLSVDEKVYYESFVGTHPTMDEFAELDPGLAIRMIVAASNYGWQANALIQLKSRRDVPSLVAAADFLMGDNVFHDARDAARLYIAAADQGSVYAVYQMGLAHLTGAGTTRDYGLARALIADAAARGMPQAQTLLAELEAEERTQAERDAEARHINQAKAAAAERMKFILNCGYVPPDEQHKWYCME